jgi:hydrophobe/amphiphile efflux-1 (HAE1) family protein
MNISELSIKKPVFAWMLMTALILFGWISFQRMGVGQVPDVDFPVVNISVTLEGAAPEVMELNVVEPIEESVMSVQGIKSVSSSSATGRANITVEFDLNRNIDAALQDIQSTLAQTQRNLPKDIDPPVVSKVNPEDQPVLWLAVMSDQSNPQALMAYVREHVKDRFTTIEGVGEIILGGFIDPNLRVTLSAKELRRHELTIADVVAAIQNEHSELPAGRIETKNQEINVRTMGEAANARDFSQLSINRRGGAPNFVATRLGDVATVEEGLADVRRLSRSGGRTAVGLGIKKQRGANAVDVATRVKAQLSKVSANLPKGMSIAVNFDATHFIEEAVHELNFTLILSAVLTALVCWIFLGSFSATLNVIFAIPTSIVGTFIVLYALNFTLNTFTLLGLSLAIGIVVDDAIMVLENIVRHREMGKSRFDAALAGSREITFAALAATAAVIAIFLPVAFMKGLIGRYFFQFGVTLSVAVALSLLEALTLAPMRCSQFLEVGERRTRLGKFVEWLFHRAEAGYAQGLRLALNHRWLILALASGLFIGSCGLVKFLKKEFVPAQDQGLLLMRVQTPTGSSLEFTDTKFKEIESIVKNSPEMLRYYAAIGGFGGGEVDTGIAFVTMKPRAERGIRAGAKAPLTQQQYADQLRKDFSKVKDAKVFLQDLSLAGFSSRRGFPVEFTIRGPDWDTLVKSAQRLMGEMSKSGLMTDVDSDYRSGQPELRIYPDRQRAIRRGVSVLDINQTINALVGGQVVGKFNRGNYRYDIRVRLRPDERDDIEDIKALTVRNNRGELVPLSDVVTITQSTGVKAIAHQDRERAISVFANVASGVSQQAALEAVQKSAATVLPEGYRAVVGGSAETFKESFQQLIFALILGIAVAYMVLASQFNSFIHPLVVLLALPFSLSGAFIALLIGGQSLNIYSMIGIILLMGIVKKNSILLVDFTNQLRATGLGVRDSLLKACPVRLRPILMTSLATVVGALPPALAIGPGAESRVPMAITVIGGIIVSTLLTLFVVPCAYSLVNRESQKSQKWEDQKA